MGIQLQAERYHSVLFLQIEYRVACVEPFDAGLGVEQRHGGVELHGHAGFGAEEVDASQEAVGLLELRQQGPQAVAEGEEDALYLVVLVEVQFAQVVAQLHHLGGLDEGRLVTGALVLYEAAHLAAVGGEEGDDGAAVADGHLGAFGGPAFALGAGQGAVDLGVDLGGLAGLGAPYLG